MKYALLNTFYSVVWAGIYIYVFVHMYLLDKKCSAKKVIISTKSQTRSSWPLKCYWYIFALWILTSMSLGDRFCVSRKDGRGEVGGCTQRVQLAWLPRGLVVESPWLAMSGPFLIFAQMGLENGLLEM